MQKCSSQARNEEIQPRIARIYTNEVPRKLGTGTEKVVLVVNVVVKKRKRQLEQHGTTICGLKAQRADKQWHRHEKNNIYTYALKGQKQMD